MTRRLARCSLPVGRLALAFLGVGLGGAVTRLAAQDMPVPVEVQVPLLLKILAFDRALTGTQSDSLVVGIAFQGRNRTSSEIGAEARRQLTAGGRQAVAGRAIRVVAIDLDATDDISAILLRDSVRVLYVAPLRAVAISSVAAATRQRLVVSFTGIPRYVEQGLSVGIDVDGTHPQIVINLPASRAEGALFAADLLKLARITGEETGAR
jgi:YfiR/HmsC-like